MTARPDRTADARRRAAPARRRTVLTLALTAAAVVSLAGPRPGGTPRALAGPGPDGSPGTGVHSPLSRAGDSAFVADDYRYCTTCHGADARGNAALDAPRLAGLSRWYIERQIAAFQAGWRGGHADDLIGLEMAPVAQMLADDEAVRAAATLVTGMTAPPAKPTLGAGDPAQGAALYDPCVACHGPQGEGVRQVGGPALAGQNDWYLKRQMILYRDGLRGAHDADTAGRTMAPFAARFTDEAALADLIAYINTLGAAPDR
ncbi:hypothetical protein CCR85_14400 [Rhodothalassium salexigens]|uniref:c-type cytochrome n=1 Tax=Rhodothalassium salexigens TaxID=1086 RepID=UPI0019137452|nr:c-type cytochrome [Rhodothalassium salexigens]MBK5912672.1 hypothetical protein [Rhodothalassium salexigens]MBK5920805.1 hypothetical protein [Rhodothalassium salexigens]